MTRIGVLTSGGDAPGMNAAVRAIVRAGIQRDAEVFAVREGWAGAVAGGGHIVPMGWEDVSGILGRGGTVIGTARCAEFRESAGQREAVANLIGHGIDRLIVIGGDGSLTGTRALSLSWGDHVARLLADGRISAEQAAAHPALMVVGLVGSIDNDMVGTDMTIGTDTALHRITEALDAISSTAESHQRTFIVEVMGRRCGYLSLMSTIAGGADYAFLPERPPSDGWEQRLTDLLARTRAAGRRDSIVVVAEGAADRQGTPITAERIRGVLAARTGEDAKVTILGHVQRGGVPSAYDRWMATLCGVEAVDRVLAARPGEEPLLIGVHRDQVRAAPLMESVAATRRVADHIAAADYDSAIRARGRGFETMIEVYRTVTESEPAVVDPEQSRRILLMHAGALAPGMNQLARVAVRTGLHLGHRMLAVRGGVPGLVAGNVTDVAWVDVEGMATAGGAEFGTRRYVPAEADLYHMARQLEEHRVDAMLVMGGFHAYATVELMERERRRYPAFDIPIAVVPASIDNNLPGWTMSVGSDTALNTVVSAIDMVRMSASASRRAFIVETMGRGCGFLTLMGGLAGGAEKAYLPENGITLGELEADVANLRLTFERGRNFHLSVVGENASEFYTTDVLRRLFEAEAGGAFSVRQNVIGHVQQGGTPSPFDRINATRLAWGAIRHLDRQLAAGDRGYTAATNDQALGFAPLREVVQGMDWDNQRPTRQWWLGLAPVLQLLSRRPEGLSRAGG